ARQKEEADLCCGEYLNDPYIFCNEFGNFVDPSTLRNWSKGVAEKAGIKHYYPHILRKSFATLAAQNMDIKSLSAILGHSSCSVSINHYIASNLETKHKAVEKLTPVCQELLENIA
ncbi:MAG: tyrosine-type recombinase/integrase, partial [Oscillospiraceae bacterium]|nr:tyrosine-type recombinase/integrase [Oscillospiraceae bacterium]